MVAPYSCVGEVPPLDFHSVFRKERGSLLFSAAPGSPLWDVLNSPWPHLKWILWHMPSKGIFSFLSFRQILSQRFSRLTIYLLTVSPMCQEPHPHILLGTGLSKLPSFSIGFFPLSGHTPNLILALSHLDPLDLRTFVIHSLLVFLTVCNPIAVGFPIFQDITFLGSAAFHFCQFFLEHLSLSFLFL